MPESSSTRRSNNTNNPRGGEVGAPHTMRSGSQLDHVRTTAKEDAEREHRHQRQLDAERDTRRSTFLNKFDGKAHVSTVDKGGMGRHAIKAAVLDVHIGNTSKTGGGGHISNHRSGSSRRHDSISSGGDGESSEEDEKPSRRSKSTNNTTASKADDKNKTVGGGRRGSGSTKKALPERRGGANPSPSSSKVAAPQPPRTGSTAKQHQHAAVEPDQRRSKDRHHRRRNSSPTPSYSSSRSSSSRRGRSSKHARNKKSEGTKIPSRRRRSDSDGPVSTNRDTSAHTKKRSTSNTIPKQERRAVSEKRTEKVSATDDKKSSRRRSASSKEKHSKHRNKDKSESTVNVKSRHRRRREYSSSSTTPSYSYSSRSSSTSSYNKKRRRSSRRKDDEKDVNKHRRQHSSRRDVVEPTSTSTEKGVAATSAAAVVARDVSVGKSSKHSNASPARPVKLSPLDPPTTRTKSNSDGPLRSSISSHPPPRVSSLSPSTKKPTVGGGRNAKGGGSATPPPQSTTRAIAAAAASSSSTGRVTLAPLIKPEPATTKKGFAAGAAAAPEHINTKGTRPPPPLTSKSHAPPVAAKPSAMITAKRSVPSTKSLKTAEIKPSDVINDDEVVSLPNTPRETDADTTTTNPKGRRPDGVEKPPQFVDDEEEFLPIPAMVGGAKKDNPNYDPNLMGSSESDSEFWGPVSPSIKAPSDGTAPSRHSIEFSVHDTQRVDSPHTGDDVPNVFPNPPSNDDLHTNYNEEVIRGDSSNTGLTQSVSSAAGIISSPQDNGTHIAPSSHLQVKDSPGAATVKTSTRELQVTTKENSTSASPSKGNNNSHHQSEQRKKVEHPFDNSAVTDGEGGNMGGASPSYSPSPAQLKREKYQPPRLAHPTRDREVDLGKDIRGISGGLGANITNDVLLAQHKLRRQHEYGRCVNSINRTTATSQSPQNRRKKDTVSSSPAPGAEAAAPLTKREQRSRQQEAVRKTMQDEQEAKRQQKLRRDSSSNHHHLVDDDDGIVMLEERSPDADADEDVRGVAPSETVANGQPDSHSIITIKNIKKPADNISNSRGPRPQGPRGAYADLVELIQYSGHNTMSKATLLTQLSIQQRGVARQIAGVPQLPTDTRVVLANDKANDVDAKNVTEENDTDEVAAIPSASGIAPIVCSVPSLFLTFIPEQLLTPSLLVNIPTTTSPGDDGDDTGGDSQLMAQHKRRMQLTLSEVFAHEYLAAVAREFENGGEEDDSVSTEEDGSDLLGSASPHHHPLKHTSATAPYTGPSHMRHRTKHRRRRPAAAAAAANAAASSILSQEATPEEALYVIQLLRDDAIKEYIIRVGVMPGEHLQNNNTTTKSDGVEEDRTNNNHEKDESVRTRGSPQQKTPPSSLAAKKSLRFSNIQNIIQLNDNNKNDDDPNTTSDTGPTPTSGSDGVRGFFSPKTNSKGRRPSLTGNNNSGSRLFASDIRSTLSHGAFEDVIYSDLDESDRNNNDSNRDGYDDVDGDRGNDGDGTALQDTTAGDDAAEEENSDHQDVDEGNSDHMDEENEDNSEHEDQHDPSNRNSAAASDVSGSREDEDASVNQSNAHDDDDDKFDLDESEGGEGGAETTDHSSGDHDGDANREEEEGGDDVNSRRSSRTPSFLEDL